MISIFILVYLLSFIMSLYNILLDNRQGFMLFLIFGLSIYTTAMSVAFMLGLKEFIPFFQGFKELLVFIMLLINIAAIRTRPRWHVIDYLIMAFLGYTTLYALLPIGELSFVTRLTALKSTSFFLLVYFTGRLFDLKSLYINKYFTYIAILAIAAGAVVSFEAATYEHLQSHTGYADYVYYYFNIEPDGSFGLSTTFESEGGYKRFGSFYTNPLEHAAATLIALAVIMALYTRDDNKIEFKPLAVLAFGATLLSIIFAFSRAPFASYFIMIYVYALVTHKKSLIKLIHYGFGLVACYLIYQIMLFDDKTDGIIAVIISTLNFSNPSSVGHVVAWLEGITAIASHPLGMGMGATGRVGASLNDEVVGGENQYLIIGVQAGLIALILYLSIYVMFIKQGLKWVKLLKGKERKICIAVLMLKIGFLIPSFTSEFEGSSYISYMNWFLSGLFIATIMQHKPDEVQDAKTLQIPANG
jgi:hypothetical protein